MIMYNEVNVDPKHLHIIKNAWRPFVCAKYYLECHVQNSRKVKTKDINLFAKTIQEPFSSVGLHFKRKPEILHKNCLIMRS